jgi:L-alanine-DL-glutamate epimerase-like enolase superfamily enzyme
MIVESIRASALTIPFKAAFKHAAATRAHTQTFWVAAGAADRMLGFGEGCPREYVTGETLRSAHAFLVAHRSGWLAAIEGVSTLVDWASNHRSEIDANPSAWAAVELALLDLTGKLEHRPVEALLGLPDLAGRFYYTAVLGDTSARGFDAQLVHYVHAGFRDFKIKLSGDPSRDRTKVASLAAAGIPPRSVRADVNNLWRDAGAAIRYIETLNFPFFAVEEPLAPGDYEGMRRLAAALDTRIVLDESLLRCEQLDRLPGSTDHWIVNVRVSKMGGLLRSLDIVRAARARGLRIVVGAHVGETSVLTRAALTVAANARDVLLAQEGAFGTHFLERDVTDPPLMFSGGGILDASTLGVGRTAGFGLAVSELKSHAASLDAAGE